MRASAFVALLIGLGCVSHREPRRPAASQANRCTLRVSQRGTFVDGEPMSRSDAVDHCKRTDGAVIVIEDDVPCSDWEPTCSALRRERVSISMRGPVGDFRQPPPIAVNAPPTKPMHEEPLVRCQAICND